MLDRIVIPLLALASLAELRRGRAGTGAPPRALAAPPGRCDCATAHFLHSTRPTGYPLNGSSLPGQ